MTKNCIICKKHPIANDKTRSFHKFPVNPILRNKWLSALKLANVSNNSRVCSDHFMPNSYHETDNYRTIKRLLADAVPFLGTNNAALLDNCDPVINDTIDTEESIMINEDDSTVESINIRPSKYNEDDDSDFDDNCTYSKNESLMTEEEKCILESGLDVKLIPKRKIRFMDGYHTKYISRTDFVSTEAWYRFLKLLSIKNAQIKASQKKSARREEKLLSYKQLIKNLADKKVTIAADYLKDIE